MKKVLIVDDNSEELRKSIRKAVIKKAENAILESVYKNMPEHVNKNIINQDGIFPKILICSKCKSPVEGFYKNRPYYGFYSCWNCKAITKDVEWKKQNLVS